MMEYLLMMSLSGSVMTVIYLVMRCLFRDKVSERFYYLLAKAAVLYYLIPLPFLKEWYREAFWRILPEEKIEIVQIPLAWTSYIIRKDEKMFFNFFIILQGAVVAVWLLIVCFLTGRMVMDYMRASRVIVRCADRSIAERRMTLLDQIKAQCGVRQKVILCSGYAGTHTMTFGVRKPVIVCDREIGNRDAELLLRHEMVHIKRRDVLWKILMQFTVILHWWNPFVWVLNNDFEYICECSCDDMVMQGKTEKEVRVYRALLVREALGLRQTEKTPLRWEAGFGIRQNGIKERVENLMKKKKWNRFTATALVAVLAFANSLTVFAYRDTYQETALECVSEEDVEWALHNDMIWFISDGADEEEIQKLNLREEIEIQYDYQFIDEEGNIYPLSEDASVETYRACSHTYSSGTISKHEKNSNGGCVVKTYKAQRCTKCGDTIWGEQVGWNQYDVCPH